MDFVTNTEVALKNLKAATNYTVNIVAYITRQRLQKNKKKKTLESSAAKIVFKTKESMYLLHVIIFV